MLVLAIASVPVVILLATLVYLERDQDISRDDKWSDRRPPKPRA